jgi:hypothetical protein
MDRDPLKVKMSSKNIFVGGGSDILNEVVVPSRRQEDAGISDGLQEEEEYVLTRLGYPNPNMKGSSMRFALKRQLSNLLNRIYDIFYVENGQIFLLDRRLDEEKTLKALVRDIMSVYYTAKLTSLKSSTRQDDFRQFFEVFLRRFEDLLKFYAHRNESSQLATPSQQFSVFLSLGFLVTAVARFMDEEARTRTEPALALLISFATPSQLAEVFMEILPPAHQSRLFALTVYADLQMVEQKFDSTGEREHISKLKAVMEVAFKRYGDNFLSFYSDELFVTFETVNLMKCPRELWNLATQGNGKVIQTELGASFLVNLIKYQWGIIADFNGVVADPSINAILMHTDLKNLFIFLHNQAQQLYLLVSALNYVLNDETHTRSAFRKDSDTLIRVYVELMDYVTRLSSALIDEYDVIPQSSTSTLSPQQSTDMLQPTKFYILLLSLSICSIQLSLTGPLHISNAPPFSQIIEYYIGSVDFTMARNTCKIKPQFANQFKLDSSVIFSNYSIIKDLSKPVLEHLSGQNSKMDALGTGLTWNFLSFCILVLVAFSAAVICSIRNYLVFIDDFFLY